jgi:spore maturation protein SpmA
MLNYVWLALLFLGIGAALSTDIIHQSTNKYRNHEALPVEIIFDGRFDRARDSIYHVNIRVSASDYNNFYSDDIEDDIILPARVSFNHREEKYTFYFKLPAGAPAIWREMAAVSGNNDDLSGSILFGSATNESSFNAGLIFEEATFLGLKNVTNSALDYAGTAVNIALGLIGIMALWLGVMKVAEEAGLITIIARMLRPLTTRLFPEVPSDHPAMGSMIMNISANMLGLGNAATPFGLKAMEELDNLNPMKGTATNAMVTFLAVNTAGMTLIPASAIAIRAASGSSDPALIIGTALFGSTCATITGITAAKLFANFPLKTGSFTGFFSKNIKGILITALILSFILVMIFSGLGSMIFASVSANVFKSIVQIISTIAIPFLIIFFIGFGAIRKVKVYEKFVEGAKEGFNIAVRIIPFLVAMLVAIGIFRAGGAMDWLIYVLRPVTDFIGMPAEALPMALMRPLSGSGSLGIMAETMAVHGPDSYIGILVSTFFGSTETTFYVLAVYFGAVNIRNTRHALPVGLLADVVGILAATFIVGLLYGGQ